ncbi:Uu.00g090050.m01.CDS01 [Anthostomella pinea]|uniref:Uu.00g090050.m01.CDS01 n=1 Tax=Anthostomella pinea TaxID=933095 RepID=A0AAI8VMV0_9PEZI|nr:Uu.00g090050.m01.CDS01 [Anthostomella pinea]
MMNLVCVGACYLDTIIRQALPPPPNPRRVPHYPEEDSKLRATRLQVRRGGNCPNTLEVLQQLLQLRREQDGRGVVRPYLVSCLPSPESPAVTRIIDSFGADTAVDLSRCIYRLGSTEPASCYVLRSEASGSRTLVNHSDLPKMTTDEFATAVDGLGDDDTWFHFEGRIPETTLQCIQSLRRSNSRVRGVSVEIEKPGRDGLEDLAAEADVVFYSRSWAESKHYETAQQCVRAQSGLARRASHLLCTWGSEGAACLFVPSGNTVSCPATHPGQATRVVDTVGAGDTFVAGMLFGLLCHGEDWDVETKVRFAVQLATCKVQREGFDGVGADVLSCFDVASATQR